MVSCCGCCWRILTSNVTQVTSERNIGKFAYTVHPHLRGRTTLRFTSRDALQPCDVLFLALPHGEAQTAH